MVTRTSANELKHVLHAERAKCSLRELGLDLHIVFNRDAVMILPPGMTKAWARRGTRAMGGFCRHAVAGCRKS